MQAKSTARARTPLFEGLPAPALDEIYRQMAPRHFAARQVICREGEPGDSLFVIQSGLAQVGVGGTVIARLRRGDVVGEQSLITGEPRSATVVAGVPTDVLELRREAFAAILARHPAVLTNLSRILSRRLARVSGRQAEGVQRGEAVALVTGARAAGLIPAALEATGSASPRSVVALDSTRTEGRGPRGEGREASASARRTHHSSLITHHSIPSPPLPEPGIAGVLAILDDLLAAHGTVVAVAAADDPHLPLLLEQMDRVVALVDEEEAARLAAGAGALADRIEVVLPGGPRRPHELPRAVAGLRAIHACDLDQPGPDLAWLGRHLARTKLGLALGAGGAKGFAHIATLAVLEEAGYTVDYVAGSSVGAMVGCWLGLGRDAAAVEETMRRTHTPENVAAMFKLSLSGLSAGLDVMTQAMRDSTEDRAFADLAIPVVVMCVDLSTQRPAPLAEGPLWQALLAATALPGMFPPYQRGEQRLVDGLALVPVPVDAVREAGADVVLSVNIMSRDTLPAWPGEQPPEPAARRSGSRMLDTLLEVMDLSQLDASVRHAARADVVVTPRFGPCTWRDFHLADLFLAAGRRAAEEQLAALRALARPQAPALSSSAV